MSRVKTQRPKPRVHHGRGASVDFRQQLLAEIEQDGFVRRTGKRAAKSAGEAAWSITRFLPKAVIKGYGKLKNVLNMIPGYSKLGRLDRGFILFQAALDLFQAGKDTVKGFLDEQGGFFSKLTSGLLSGAKSFAKAAGVLGASTFLSFAPALMGFTGPVGWILGLAGAVGGGMLTRFVLDKLVDTHGHVRQTPVVDQAPAAVPQNGDDIVRQIDYTWRHRTFDPNGHREPNPWLNMDFNFKPERL